MTSSVKLSKDVNVPLKKWKDLLMKQDINSKLIVLNKIDKVIKDWEKL